MPAQAQAEAAPAPSQRFLRWLAWGFAGLALGQALGLLRLQAWPAAAPDLCWFHRLTGRPCPGCGMGRALLLLAQGRLAEAWRAHPFAPVLLGLAGAAALLPAERYRRLSGSRWSSVVLAALGLLLLLHWLSRVAGA